MKRKKLYLGVLLIVSLSGVSLAWALGIADPAPREPGERNWAAGDVELSAGYQQVAFPGETITFKHAVRHIGSGSAAINLAFAADHPGWVVDFPTSVVLDTGETATIELVVHPPGNVVESTMSQITVTATGGNPSGQVNAVNTIQVLSRGWQIHLPLIAQGWATPTPQLREIENLNGDGAYVVRWSLLPDETSYVLQEATNAAFTNASTAYSGPDLSTVIEGKSVGVYYYRMQASGGTTWSPTETTLVIPYNGIFGTVAYKQAASPGTSLDLRCYDSYYSWYTADTATTESHGIYVFDSAPALDGSEYCYVRYTNTTDSRYLYLWANYYIYYYTPGTTTTGGDFDIANVTLGGPDSSATIQSFPLTFHWTPRSASPNDSYELRILNAYSGAEVWTSGPLGYVGSYQMNGRPSALSAGVLYGWDVLIYGDEGVGISYETHSVVFDGDALACLYIQNDTGGNMTFRIHGRASKTMPTGWHLYDCFPPGSYTYTASAWCGSLTDSDYFSTGSQTLSFYCGMANLLALPLQAAELAGPGKSIPRLPDSALHQRLGTGGER